MDGHGDRRPARGAAARRAPTASESLLARVGVAFQLTNLIRDVREDWGMGRVYLPGLHEEDLERRAATHRLREHVAAAGRPRPRAVPRHRRARPDRCPRRCAPACASRRPSTPGCSTASSARATTSSTRSAGLRPWETARAVVGALAP